MSPTSVKIIRVLMDISFVWSYCTKNNHGERNIIFSLVKEGLKNLVELLNFFHEHLEKDVRDLSKLTGKKFEDVLFILHLVVKSLMDASTEQCKEVY